MAQEETVSKMVFVDNIMGDVLAALRLTKCCRMHMVTLMILSKHYKRGTKLKPLPARHTKSATAATRCQHIEWQQWRCRPTSISVLMRLSRLCTIPGKQRPLAIHFCREVHIGQISPLSEAKTIYRRKCLLKPVLWLTN